MTAYALQTAVRPAAAPQAHSVAPPSVHPVLNSPGRPLDAATRGFMEPRFGHDFSRVRVHTDPQAARSAQAVNALAYTVGRHIAFDAGQYRPDTRSGRQLVAHELVHVVQQTAHGQAAGSDLRIAGNDAAEQEAERLGASIDGSMTGTLGGSLPVPAMQRQLNIPAYVVPRPCERWGNCPPPPPAPSPSPIPGCSAMLHQDVMLELSRNYVLTQLDPSLTIGVSKLDCFGGVGPCTFEFDSGVAVETSMLLMGPYAQPGSGGSLVFIKEVVPSASQGSLKYLLHKRFGPRCSYDVGCDQAGKLTRTLLNCRQTGPFNPDDNPQPSGNERIA